LRIDYDERAGSERQFPTPKLNPKIIYRVKLDIVPYPRRQVHDRLGKGGQIFFPSISPWIRQINVIQNKCILMIFNQISQFCTQ